MSAGSPFDSEAYMCSCECLFDILHTQRMFPARTPIRASFLARTLQVSSVFPVQSHLPYVLDHPGIEPAPQRLSLSGRGPDRRG